jgi:hypothetical protein
VTKKRQKGEFIPAERPKHLKLLDEQEKLPTTQNSQLIAKMTEHHPIHGLFGEIFEETGGKDRLHEWAEDNYDKFIQIFSKMAPAPQSAGHNITAIQIQIDPTLGTRKLDE